MSQLDEVEYARLADQVEEIEKLVNSGQPGEVSLLLKTFLRNAKSRMEEIRHDEVRVDDQKKDHKANEISTAVQLAEMEQNLGAQEKQQYSGFLKLDYFTKSNFSELDQFYSDSWDKLSEEGKSQMSYRVWEGIRHNEFTFDELPKNVRKKEEERLYEQLTGLEANAPAWANIPERDREDFIHEHEAGNEKAAAEVLNRKSFSTCVSRYPSKDSTIRGGTLTEEAAIDRKDGLPSSREQNEAVREVALQGFTLADASEVVRPDIQASTTGPRTVGG